MYLIMFRHDDKTNNFLTNYCFRNYLIELIPGTRSRGQSLHRVDSKISRENRKQQNRRGNSHFRHPSNFLTFHSTPSSIRSFLCILFQHKSVQG